MQEPAAPHVTRPTFKELVVNRFTYPADHPFISLTAYYLAVFGVAALLFWLFPPLREVLMGERLAAMIKGGDANQLSVTGPLLEGNFSAQLAGFMAVAMIGSLIMMVPTSWVYMATRQRKGFDQTIVQTLIILAMAVSGVVVIVRNSLALAFSLAGIVGAVRFRNSLPDTRDTLYIFLAIGVGLASGVAALGAAAVLSVLFNYTVLFLNKANYGMCELGKSSRPLLLTHAPIPSQLDRHGKEKNGKKGDFNGVLVVRTREADETRRRLALFLDQELKRWSLAEIETSKKGRAHLKYLVRTRKGTTPEELEDAILAVGGEHVVGVKVH